MRQSQGLLKIISPKPVFFFVCLFVYKKFFKRFLWVCEELEERGNNTIVLRLEIDPVASLQ